MTEGGRVGRWIGGGGCVFSLSNKQTVWGLSCLQLQVLVAPSNIYLHAELGSLASFRKHEVGYSLRSFYFRKGDKDFFQVTCKQNTVQSKIISGRMLVKESVGEVVLRRCLGEKSGYLFSLVWGEFGYFNFLSNFSGKLFELYFSFPRWEVTHFLPLQWFVSFFIFLHRPRLRITVFNYY